jgi:hypothetical protein
MNRVILELPETLHRQLEAQARNEGVSLSQYILYALTRQASFAYYVQPVSAEVRQQEREAFARLIESSPAATNEEMARFLREREPVEPEAELSPEAVAQLQRRIQDKRTLS